MPAPALFLLALTYLGFISLGLPDAVTGVVWPSVYRQFGLPPATLGVVLAATASGYMVSSLLTGRLLQRLGVGGLLASSCALVTLSLVGFALAPAFWAFALSAVVAGLGAGAIDSGLNAHAARHFSARQMNWLHACWGIGATAGASTAATVLARGWPWSWAYACLAVVMAALTAMFALNARAWQTAPEETPGAVEAPKSATMGEALRHPVVWAQVGLFFLYCGVEMTAGNWAFALLTQYREVSVGMAGAAVTLFWGALTAGRFLLGAIADHVGVKRLLGLSVTAAALGALTFVLAPWPLVGIFGLATLGFSLAPLYPGLMTQTPERLGHLSEHAVGFQVAAAMLGTVTFPSIGGWLLQAFGPAWLNGLLGVLAVGLWLAMLGLLGSARLAR